MAAHLITDLLCFCQRSCHYLPNTKAVVSVTISVCLSYKLVDVFWCGCTDYLRGGFLHEVDWSSLWIRAALTLFVSAGTLWLFSQRAHLVLIGLLQFGCDVMLLKSASLCVCQFKPAVPKHRLTLCICLDQFLLVEDLCNAEQSRPHLATFTQADVTFVLVPLLFTSCYFSSSLFTLSQLCRCCSTNPPRPTLHLRAMSEQCSTSKDWVRINSWLKPVKFVDGILENSQRKHSCWLIMDVGYNWSAVICVSEINYMGAFKKNSIFSYFLCFAMKLYIYIPFAYWVVNS